MRDQAIDKRSPIIGGAVLLTLVFLALFLALLSLGELPAGCKPGAWLIDRIACLEPNALGDLFAGAFAPVAFVWLVAAVMLQRIELKAQRQELWESRQVAAQQVEEARKNVAFIEAQTSILESNKALEMRRDADEQFEEMLDVFNRSFLNCEKFLVWENVYDVVEREKSVQNFRMKFHVDGDLVEKTKKNLESISVLSFELMLFQRDDSKFYYKDLRVFATSVELLDALEKKLGEVSPATRARAIYMNLPSTAKEAREILETLKTGGIEAHWREAPDRDGKFPTPPPTDDEIPF